MPGTKLADVLYYLRRAEGVSPEELMHRFQWKRETAVTAVSDLRLYYGIDSKRFHDGRYRIVATLNSGNAAPTSPRIIASHEQVGPVSN